MTAGRQQTRLIFNKSVPSAANVAGSSTERLTTSEEVEEHIQSAFEIASYLRKNVVQGIQKEDGRFGESLLPPCKCWS